MGRYVYGIHAVEELLRARRDVAAIHILDGELSPPLQKIAQAARAAHVDVQGQPREALDALVPGARHQGVVAVAGEFSYLEPSEVVARATETGEAPLLLVLDGVQDPQNLGALIRSAHILGVHGLIIPRDRAAPVSPAAVRASAGASEHMPIARCANVARLLDELKAAGIWTVGAVADGGHEPPSDPWQIDFTGPTALVLGAEGKGIRPLVQRGCDLRVRIPMHGRVASLNVGAAGAILLYEAARQRALAAKRAE